MPKIHLHPQWLLLPSMLANHLEKYPCYVPKSEQQLVICLSILIGPRKGQGRLYSRSTPKLVQIATLILPFFDALNLISRLKFLKVILTL